MADEHLISLQPGTVIAGRYEVVKCLGAGSMGLVYACRHRELAGHLVAIKVLFPEVAQDNVAAARFRNEIVASYGVSHPNVVRAYEYFRDGDLVAYTMEYVGGGDLADRLSGGDPLPVPEIIRLLSQITSGVQSIHDAGIVHRDLKPENILLTPEGDVKITDFGIARTGHGPKLTEHGGVVGTIDYVSPEYLEKGQVDARSDIYALGVLAYEMLTGESPFRGDSVIATMTMRLRSDPPPPGDLRPDCPPELDAIIKRAMARSPEERYQRAIDIYYDLQPLMPESATSSGGYQYPSGRPEPRSSEASTPESPGPPRTPSVVNVPGSSFLSSSDSAGSRPSQEGMFSATPPSPAPGPSIQDRGIAHIASQYDENTLHEPLRMESVLSSSQMAAAIDRSASQANQISVNRGGLDRGRIRTLSQSVGDFQRSSWIVDSVLLIVAIMIGVGVGLAALHLLWPDFFREKPSYEQGADISIFDNDYYP